MWWRGQQTGILGNDVESRAAATAPFRVTGSPYPVITPDLLRRRRLESGARVRVDVFPAPRFTSPTELQMVTLSGDGNLHLDFEIPKNVPARYFKLAIYEERFVLSPTNKERRPAVFTDDGKGGTATFAEWVLLSAAATKISGAPAGWQRYRTEVATTNLYNARVDNKRFTAAVRYADAREGDYRSSEVDVVSFEVKGSNAATTFSAPIIFDTPTFLTKPVIEAAPPNPVYIDQAEDWVLNLRYLSRRRTAAECYRSPLRGRPSEVGSGGKSYYRRLPVARQLDAERGRERSLQSVDDHR